MELSLRFHSRHFINFEREKENEMEKGKGQADRGKENKKDLDPSE